MKNSKFWSYQFKSFLPLLIAYFLFLGLLKLLSILYFLPNSFFGDTIRFSFPLLVIWFLFDSYQTARRVKILQKEHAIPVNNPVEATLLQSYRTQRRESDQAIRQLNNRQQNQFDHVELYSHEIKNLLTSLQAAAENDDVVSSKVVQSAVQQANYHLDMLLSDERLSLTSNDFNFEWVDLQKLIMTILKQNSAIFINHQLVPQLEDLNGVKVLTDRKWLRFCIFQLLSNAIKYSPTGATIFFKWKNNSLQIIDQGIGIASDDLPRIYDNGFSGKNGHQTTKSTGMGLYLVKKITDQLNFKLEIKSTPGQGTQAILYFPGNNVQKD